MNQPRGGKSKEEREREIKKLKEMRKKQQDMERNLKNLDVDFFDKLDARIINEINKSNEKNTITVGNLKYTKSNIEALPDKQNPSFLSISYNDVEDYDVTPH